MTVYARANEMLRFQLFKPVSVVDPFADSTSAQRLSLQTHASGLWNGNDDCTIVPDLVFSNACANHDTCYAACNSNKLICDSNFHFDMVKDCLQATRYLPARQRTIALLACLDAAAIYFFGVVLLGQDFYDKAQNPCNPNNPPPDPEYPVLPFECFPNSICWEIPLIASVDPNDITGLAGFGDARWISNKQLLPYTIRFENDPELATAPAHVVSITQKLNTTLDIRTFRLGNFGFGSFNFTVPENRSYYTQRLDVRDSLSIFVDVTAGIDVTKNEAFWIFKSIDPATGEAPTDPFAGFLPVNDSTGVGQGFVSYTIRPRADAKTREVIDAQARIVFDINEPIDTPAIFNTIDADAPISRVNALPAAISTTEFTVSWTASDSGSGIQDYTLYASEGEQPFAPYQSAIADTFTTFTGEFNKT